jgi:hypothetical protein
MFFDWSVAEWRDLRFLFWWILKQTFAFPATGRCSLQLDLAIAAILPSAPDFVCRGNVNLGPLAAVLSTALI